MRYRKKPVEVEAIRFDGENVDDILSFTGPELFAVNDRSVTFVDPPFPPDAYVWDKLHYTWVGVKKGQWIIRGIQGEFYPCEHDVFVETYEMVE